MKSLIYTFLLTILLVPAALAQRNVDAKEVFRKIDRQEAVDYQNVTITGDLDLTELSNKKRRNEERWSGEAYQSRVQVPVTFRNCRFTGKFLAYKNLKEDSKLWNDGVTYTTDFDEAVTFENCTFEDEAAFKYSTFRQRALFTGNTFGKETLFKYARFDNASDFSGSTFKNYANFKYTKFDEAVSFQKVRFGGYADFKYTKFDEGVSFGNAEFEELADFKYTHLPRGSHFDAARFNGATDFKYTTLDGQRFSPANRSR